MSTDRSEVFDALYARDPDPWNFAASPYERAKYDATLAALPRPRFASALEIGCSIGVLSARLAQRCDRLLGVDVSARAIDAARTRCAGTPGARFVRLEIPECWPERERFDLILLSEVLYFLTREEVRRTARRCRDSLDPGGTLLLVNWTGATDTPCTGDQAAELFLAEIARPPDLQRRADGYRLDRVGSAGGPHSAGAGAAATS